MIDVVIKKRGGKFFYFYFNNFLLIFEGWFGRESVFRVLDDDVGCVVFCFDVLCDVFI